MQAVEDEVRFQIEAAKEEMSQDFGPSQGDFQFEMMQPLDDLRFEFDSLKNQVEGSGSRVQVRSGEPEFGHSTG